MTATMHFPQANFLARLQQANSDASLGVLGALPSSLERLLLPLESRSEVMTSLTLLLGARKATLQAAFDTTLAADELRRYQKFAKPGKPSAHIVQLRQKQAAARQASSISRQSLIKAATVLVREL